MRESIGTFTGKTIEPLNAREEDICIEDIAHALSMTCRYTGHCKEFYSVAQHSVLVSRYSDNKFTGLMHDAAEAYLADIAKPIKHLLENFEKIEDELYTVIARKFGLMDPIPKDVHIADKRLLVSEYEDLMAGSLNDTWKEYDRIPQTIKPWSPEESEQAFLHEFHFLKAEGES